MAFDDRPGTRAEHLAWCKERALQELNAGGVGLEAAASNAWSSMLSDMDKHAETRGHSALKLGTMLLFGGQLSTREKMRKFIEGFN